MSTQKNTGNVKTLALDINEPFKFKTEGIDYNQVAIFVGANGSGKSFILICTWAVATIAQMIVIANPAIGQLIQYAQFVFDNSFKDQNINGIMSMVFESGSTITITFDKGKIIDFSYSGFEDVNQPIQAKFMSANMRTFDSIGQYLALRNAYDVYGQEKMIEQLCKTYKLYDVMYLESLIIKMPCKVTSQLQEAFKKFDITETITEFGVDLVKNDFYCIADGKQKCLQTYGKGHQSIFNMLLANV